LNSADEEKVWRTHAPYFVGVGWRCKNLVGQ